MSSYRLFYFLSLITMCCGYNILVVFPIPGVSHSILGDGCVRLLLEAGHQVTYISQLSTINPHQNLTHIDVNPKKDIKILSHPASVILKKTQRKSSLPQINEFSTNSSIRVLQNEVVVNMLNDPKKTFDVIIVEWLLGELLSGLSAVFGCPYIWVSSLEPHWMIVQLIDDATNPAYVPTPLATYLPSFSFLQRVEQLWLQINDYYSKQQTITSQKIVYKTLLEPVIRKRGRTVPSFEDVMYNASLVLGFSDPTIGLAFSLPQSYKAVGGYHIEKDKPLPDDFKKIMDAASNGVIYFSLGTVLQESSFPENIKYDILKVFGELKQTVIWKCKQFTEEYPDNVHFFTWVPQQSILAHPNCILFINHGGLLSLTETIHFGVPIIGIPMFADQFLNMMKAERRGIGITINYSSSVGKDLKIAIKNIISDSSYAKKAKELSSTFRHRLAPPGAELVHWVEHVALTRGALHFRSPARGLHFYQKVYLDLVFVIFVLYFLVKTCIKLLLRMLVKTSKMKVN